MSSSRKRPRAQCPWPSFVRRPDPTLALVFAASLLLGGSVAWFRVRSEFGAAPTPPNATPIVVSATQHRVTHEMAEASSQLAGAPAPDFQVRTVNGQLTGLAELTRHGPCVLTFIKDGCPCSIAAQRYFNRLAEAYGDVAVFAGIIDVEAESASEWAERFGLTYSLLLDPKLELVRSYSAPNSAYVVLISPDQHIVRQWPGFSEPMLTELSTQLARMGGVASRPVDFSLSPKQDYTGCPYDLESLP